MNEDRCPSAYITINICYIILPITINIIYFNINKTVNRIHFSENFSFDILKKFQVPQI